MSGLTYQDLIRDLFPRLSGGIRWGPERTERLLGEVGDPHRRYHVLHIGGTNGKGSVAATLASVLVRSGVRVGLYTSPHLCSFRERIQIDGAAIADQALLSAAERLWPAILREDASFFEATTAIGFLAFADAGIDTAVVEVGLGGRLDATNVVWPDVVVITNVALDHTEHLGDTLEAIAAEKAGIAKPGVPLLTAEARPEIRAIFRRRARELAAPFEVLEADELAEVDVALDGTRFRCRSRLWGELALDTPLIGAHQATNTALALRALERLPPERRPTRDQIVAGVRNVRWPGRLQVERTRGRTWLLDAAHNPAGGAALVETLDRLPLPRPLVLLMGVLADKDWRSMLPPLRQHADHALLTLPPSGPEARRWEPEAAARELGPEYEAVPDFDVALERARALAGRAGTVLVTGSLYTVGDALAALGRAPFGVDAALPLAGRAG